MSDSTTTKFERNVVDSICESCKKETSCITLVRDWEGSYYKLCCKCLCKHEYFWRYPNNNVPCGHELENSN